MRSGNNSILCGECFKSKNQLHNHVSAKHKGKNLNKSRDYNSSQSPVSKQKRLDTNKQVACDECGNNFKNLNQLNRHMETDHSEGEHNCMKCSYQGNTAYSLKKHINVTHKIFCHTCSKASDSKWDLMVHRRDNHYDLLKTCRYFLMGNCKFGNEKCFYRHEENEKFKFKCNSCENVFSTKDELMKHIKEHHEETVPNCRDHQRGYCKRKENECYYSHKYMIDEVSQNKLRTPVFRKVLETTQPPDSVNKLMVMLQKLTEKVESLETIVKKDK